MEVLGIDIGFGFTKATNGKECLVFKSVLGEAAEMQYQEAILAGGAAEEHLQLEFAGRSLFLGDLAERQSQVRFFTLDQGHFVRDHAQVLAIGAGAHLVGSHIPVNVVTGLPIGFYRQHREELTRLLQGEHSVTLVLPGGKRQEKSLNVNKVRVIPQPFGSLFNLMLNDLGEVGDKRLVRDKIGLIDVGFRTCDFTISDRMRYSERGSRTTDSGISRAFAMIAGKLREKSGVNVELYRLFEAVERGALKIHGQDYDLKGLTEQVFSQLAAVIAGEAERLWADDWDLDTMVITGGGGAVLAPYLQPLLKGKVLPLEAGKDARLNNVLGYWKFGRHIAARTGS